MTTAAVVLAAGASSRMAGAAKQTLTLGGETLLDRAVRVAQEAGLSPVVVVLGARAAEVRTACRLEGVEVLENRGWPEGMGSSVRAGVRRVAAAEVGGVVVLTCDMPGVTAAHLRSLCVREGEIAASGYGGRRGVPAYFPRSSFAALGELRGDEGARALLKEARTVELSGGELDVDTPEAWNAAQGVEAEEDLTSQKRALGPAETRGDM